ESFNEGTLLYIGIQEGETAPVDSVLAIIGPAGTDVSGIAENFSNDSETKEDVKEDKKETKTENSASHSTPTNNAGGRIFASPLAKQIAKEKGIDLNQINGSGENGRIVKSDIENYTPNTNTNTSSAEATVAQAKEAVANVQPFVPAGEKLVTTSANSQMRKTIARRLGESKFTAPHYYLTIELDMDNAIASRTTINSLPDTKVSFNDLIVKACAMALKKHPQVNSQWTEKETILNHHVNIGVAVAVEDGLLVPVLPFTDQMSLTQISSSVKDLAGKAKAKKLSPAEMEGSTFTISNLGAYGIIEFTSIINQPNSAILSIGAIVEKPVVKNSQIVVGNVMKVTLACDHRTVDGATGALFLQTLKSYLENPVTMLA
ncbi:dihydrolipoamide acetyltransferase family protein, partial [uncultured Flavobacterium sp.]|uniref:dihydrolipoamide acetyltransferase family protein n=1 Tax=uncultured Flavobacterium sp. TaxID=165435 RepID=UPI0030EF2072